MQELGEVVEKADGDQCQADVGGGGEGGAIQRYRIWSRARVLQRTREVVGDFAGVFT